MAEGTPSEVIQLDDFMCACKDDGKAECEAVLADVLKRLDASPDNLLSAVVYSLQWDYGGISITSMGCDQWAGIGAKTYPLDGKPQIKAYVQCDWLEHGVARLWQMVADLYVLAGKDPGYGWKGSWL